MMIIRLTICLADWQPPGCLRQFFPFRIQFFQFFCDFRFFFRKPYTFRHIDGDFRLRHFLVDLAVSGFKFFDLGFRLFQIIFPFSKSRLFLFLLFPVEFGGRNGCICDSLILLRRIDLCQFFFFLQIIVIITFVILSYPFSLY